MDNISLELMVHHSCKIPDDEENIPQGTVMFDYSHWKHDIYLDKYNIHQSQGEVLLSYIMHSILEILI